MAAAAAIANRDHQVAIGEAPQPATPPSPAIKLAPAVNGAKKPKSPAHAAAARERHREGGVPRRLGAAPAADDPGRLADVRPDRWTVTLVFTTTRAEK